MTDLSRHTNPSQPPHHSPWTTMIIDSLRAEYPVRPTEKERQQFLTELAQRLSALREWERYDMNHLPSVTLKRGYRKIAKLDGHADYVRSVHVLPDGKIVSGSDDRSVRIWAPD